MLRRLLRFLAAREIREAEAFVRALERVNCELAVRLHIQSAYLKGHQEGVVDAMKEVEKQVRERMGGAQDLVTLEDIAAAKKGLIH